MGGGEGDFHRETKRVRLMMIGGRNTLRKHGRVGVGVVVQEVVPLRVALHHVIDHPHHHLGEIEVRIARLPRALVTVGVGGQQVVMMMMMSMIRMGVKRMMGGVLMRMVIAKTEVIVIVVDAVKEEEEEEEDVLFATTINHPRRKGQRKRVTFARMIGGYCFISDGNFTLSLRVARSSPVQKRQRKIPRGVWSAYVMTLNGGKSPLRPFWTILKAMKIEFVRPWDVRRSGNIVGYLSDRFEWKMR